jgi:hypothetical protein
MRFPHHPSFREFHDPIWLEEAGWVVFLLLALLAMVFWPGLRG